MLYALLKDLAQRIIRGGDKGTSPEPEQRGASESDSGAALDLEAACRRALAANPDCAMAHNQLGIALAETGRLGEAEDAFRRAILLERDFGWAHLNLGRLLEQTRAKGEAEVHYRHALKADPDMVEALVRLGILLSETDRLVEARAALQRAVQLRPDDDEAQDNLDLVMKRIKDRSDTDAALTASDPGATPQSEPDLGMAQGAPQASGAGFGRPNRRQCVFVEPALDPKRTVLLLVTDCAGNVPYQLLFPQTTNTRIVWTMNYATDVNMDEVPDYDLVFNAMGDPDVAGDTSGPVNAFLAVCDKPLLNHPDKVALTARNRLAALFEGIDSLVIPPVWRFNTDDEWPESLAERLPLIVRPITSHGGAKLVVASTADELARCRAEQTSPVYLTRFVDYRSADGWFRKYRMVFVDRKPLPCHLAISPNSIAHYYSSDMERHGWKVEEEKAFLRHPETVLGEAGMQAVRALAARMDLDYAGLDFSILPDKRILVFEANPTMRFYYELIGSALEHKNEFVQRIAGDFEALLQRYTSPM